MELIRATAKGLYCELGGFYIDPWQKVQTAVITHAHADHARWGHKEYYCSARGIELLKMRIETDSPMYAKAWSEKFKLGSVWVSFHPAGHILGSSQVRIEYKDQVWVASGDYKRSEDPSCDPFEVVPCDTFISEATFALPIYKWDHGSITTEKIFNWWQQDLERPTLLFCYSLGKAQRVLAELTRFTDKTVYLHGAAEEITRIYRESGIKMVPTLPVSAQEKGYNFHGDLIIAPPSAHRSVWMKKFKEPQTAFASGWMQVRGTRRRKGYERGFVLSDHADWNELNQTILETGAKTVYLTHGRTDVLAKYLEDKNIQVRLFHTEYGEEEAS